MPVIYIDVFRESNLAQRCTLWIKTGQLLHFLYSSVRDSVSVIDRECIIYNITIYIIIAEVVEWLRPSTAVRKVAGSIPAEGIFSET